MNQILTADKFSCFYDRGRLSARVGQTIRRLGKTPIRLKIKPALPKFNLMKIFCFTLST